MDHMDVLPVRGTSKGWKNGMAGTSLSSAKGNAKCGPWNSPKHWYRLGANCLKSIFAEERPGVVAMKLTMSKQCSLVEILAALGEVLLGGQSTWSFLSAQHWWSIAGDLGPVQDMDIIWRPGVVWSGGEKAQGDLISVWKCLTGGEKKMEQGSPQWNPVKEGKAGTQTEIQQSLLKRKK